MQENFNQQLNKCKIALEEEKVLEFWKKSGTFKKSLEKDAPNGDYVFYDGPPFATGTPHYGHIVASLIKDAVPRYWTMRGFRVPRRWGWDCHGLPIENIAERALGVNSKKEIEETVGVEKFNETCRERVQSYVEEWKLVINRIGRWADMENAYKTMDIEFMESVWWVFKTLWDKDLIYKGYKSMHICPRCETTLSQSEISEGYKMVKDISVTAKFKLKPEQRIGKDFIVDDFTYIIAWTTMPWTLVGNAALAVNKGLNYLLVQSKDRYIVARDRVADVFADQEYTVIGEFRGEDLLGLVYEPLFDYYAKTNLENSENGWKVYDGDFVNIDDGTGIVHIAPVFGEEDMEVGGVNNLPFIQHVSMNGVFKDEVVAFRGMHVKPNGEGDRSATDIEIVKYLAGIDRLFAKKKYEHSYPHCWRCDTSLLNYATSSWFVSVTKIKANLLETAKDINWFPKHIKDGRFGNWLDGARDWSISRQRFWASVMPIWECSCGELKVIGSVAELEELSGQNVTDLHKHVVDNIFIKCDLCKNQMKRVPDVLDTWFDSGSMPFATSHYPFENKELFDRNFPAEFIAEGIDQTRCWFYYLHVISTAIKNEPAYQNVIVNGIVLSEDGVKLSKKLGNYPDPILVINKFGADAMRYYLLSSPVMAADQFSFVEKDVFQVQRNLIMTLTNVLSFYLLFDGSEAHYLKFDEDKLENVLDIWIIAKLRTLVVEVSDNMNDYNLPKATRPINDFISDLSTWYLRRSRDRFKGDDQKDKESALSTMSFVLVEFSKVIAPLMPFIAEHVWQVVTLNNFINKDKSVHLEAWPVSLESVDSETSVVIGDMNKVRDIVELGLRERDQAKIRVRQPLSEITINNSDLSDKYLDLIKDELNIHEVIIKPGKEDLSVELNTTITSELRSEGLKRELVRVINNLRKDAGLTINDKANVFIETRDVFISEVISWHGDAIANDTLVDKIKGYGFRGVAELTEKEFEIAGAKVLIGLEKI
ncbi:isoleucine--tRNA ligase [Patescibacteria group bacterium]|nr:isoleucine--tRNA ligase [Patescibacteria group bacterium]